MGDAFFQPPSSLVVQFQWRIHITQLGLATVAGSQRIMYDDCGAVLYEGAEVKSPFEIIALYNDKCEVW